MTPSLDSARSSAARVLRDRGIGTAALDARVLLTMATGLSLEALIAKGGEPIGRDAGDAFSGLWRGVLQASPYRESAGRESFADGIFGSARRRSISPRHGDADRRRLGPCWPGKADRLTVAHLGPGDGFGLHSDHPSRRIARCIGRRSRHQPRRAASRPGECRSMGVADRARFAVSDWFEALAGRYDIIVSNPPYVASAEIGGLAPEVAEHDPLAALDGGLDGLDAYRRIAAGTPAFLVPGGHLLVEIGCTQGEAVTDLFERAGLAVAQDGIVADLAGHPRCVCAKISEA